MRRFGVLTIAFLYFSFGQSWAGEASTNQSFRETLPVSGLARLGSTRLRHTGPIHSLAWSADGKTIAAAGLDHDNHFHGLGWDRSKEQSENWIRLWDAANGKEVRRFGKQARIIRSLAFSSDGTMVASSSDSSATRLWDAVTGRELRQFPPAAHICFSPDGKTLAATAAQHVELWLTNTGQDTRRFTVPEREFTPLCLAFSPDGKWLAASGRPDEGVAIWEAATGRLLHLLHGKGSEYTLAFTHDSKALITAGPKEPVRFWDMATGKESSCLDGNASSAVCLGVSPDGEVLATALDRAVILWDIAAGKERHRLEAHSHVADLCFSPDGRTLAWSAGQAIRLTDVASGKDLASTGAEKPVTSVCFSPNGKTVLTVSDRVRLWDAASGAERISLSVPATCADFAADGRSLVVGGPDQTLRLLHAATGAEIKKFTGSPGEVEFVRFLPDNKTVASMSRHQLLRTPDGLSQFREKQVRLWDVASGAESGTIGKLMMNRVALSANGKMLATACPTQAAVIYEVAGGKELHRLDYESHAYCVAFAVDSKHLAAGTMARQFSLWELITGLEVFRFAGHEGAVLTCAFSPDNRLLASAGADHSVRLWDLDTGSEVRRFEGHKAAVLALAFSADGRRLLSGSADTTAIIWDTDRILPKIPLVELKAQEFENLWTSLADDDAGRAWQAQRRLAQNPEAAIAFLHHQLNAPPSEEARKIERMIRDLNSPQFVVRDKAFIDLGRIGERTKPALERALRQPPTEEVRRRLQRLLEKLEPRQLPPQHVLQGWRSIGLLEQFGTVSARRALEDWAKHSKDAAVAAEARAALLRISP